MRYPLSLAAVLALAGCFPLSCGLAAPTVPASQFGTYRPPFKLLRLADGDTFTVYRVKYWIFKDRSAPSLQLEYEAPIDVADSVAIRALARRVWPAFVPYVEDLGLHNAIITATNLRRKGTDLAWVSTLHHYGIVVVQDSAGRWHFVHDTVTLPPGQRDHATIFERSGAPFDTASARRTIARMEAQARASTSAR